VKIVLHQYGRQEEGVGGVVEALATRTISGKIAAGLELDAEEIAHGVVVLVAIEPADGDPAGVPRDLPAVDSTDKVIEGAQELGALGVGGMLFCFERWHVIALDLDDHLAQEAVVAKGVLGGEEFVEGKAGFLLVRAVAGEAILREDRARVRGKVNLRGGRKDEEDAGEEDSHGEESRDAKRKIKARWDLSTGENHYLRISLNHAATTSFHS
jgi:hypothetical protein